MNVKKAFLTIAASLLAAAALAQSYSIDWHTIDGGGGTSTGGVYSVSGTIGQPDAGTMSGGTYSLDGGFWSLFEMPTPAVPITIFDNIGGSANGGFGVTAATWLAGKFCLGSQAYRLDSVSLLLNSQDFSGAAGPPCTVQLQIYSHDPVSGKPSASTGLIMNLSGLTNPITLLGGQQLVKWTPATPFSLPADTCYWAVLSAENGKRMGQIASVTMPTGDAGTFGLTSSGDAGATWASPNTYGSANFKMLIQGTATAAPQDGFRIGSARIVGNALRFRFPTTAGRSYVIESRADLAAGEWTEVPGTTQNSAGASLEASLPIQASKPQQFYRVKQLP